MGARSILIEGDCATAVLSRKGDGKILRLRNGNVKRAGAAYDMKIINSVLVAGILLVTQSLRADTSVQARPVDNARLIVNRSADFGIEESVNLAIDGVQVAVLGFNQNYDAALPPGKHVLSITTNPKTYPDQSPNQIPLTAETGKTYTFTAVWTDSERASLEEQ